MAKPRCSLCDKYFTNMHLHLIKCIPRLSTSELFNDKKKVNNYILKIMPVTMKKYWLYIAIPSNSTFKQLNSFLIETWMSDDDSHLSMFTCNNKQIKCGTDNKENSNVKLSTILEVNDVLKYEYDMGFTTCCGVEVIDLVSINNNHIQIISQNTSPVYLCSVCNENDSTVICSNCSDLFCSKCSTNKKHKCRKNIDLFEIYNSPRFFLCE